MMIPSYNTGVVDRKNSRSDVGSILRPDTMKGRFMMQPHSTPSAPVVKTCTKCGETKPATTEYFSSGKTYRGGLRAICKACRVAANMEYRRANPNKRRAYESANRERKNEKARAYIADNREHVNALQRANYEAKQQDRLEKRRAYRAAKREYISSRERAYWRANPDKMKAKNARRTARRRNAPGRHTAADIQRQYEAQKGKCYYCNVKVGDTYQVDHVVPLSRGGSNGPENLVIACPTCNSSKNNRLPHEWSRGGRLL